MNEAATPLTVGVEEEYQLVDVETGALRSTASALRRGDWTGELVAELQETTIEIGTPVCASAAEAADELARLRLQASTVAAAHGLAVVAAGVHPFSSWEGHERPPLERYRRLEAAYGRIARDEHIFGMHVHVAVPPDIDRATIMNVARHFLPHLLALSASSPILEGEDTGFASFRTILWRRWPNSSVPPRFESDAEARDYIALLLDTGAITDVWNVYWSMRPHPEYPTLEFRVMDVCPSLRDAAALVALVRAIVHAALQGTLKEPVSSRRLLEQEMLRLNEWRAARDGLDARWIDTIAGAGHQPMRTAIRQLLDRLGRVAEELGDAAEFGHIETIVERGNAADRMRRELAERGSTRELVTWLIDECQVGVGLDRRATQRAESG